MDDKPSYDELAIAVRGYEEECKALKAQLEDIAVFNNPEDAWAHARAVEYQRDELAAHVERLREALSKISLWMDGDPVMCQEIIDVVKQETPAQSLERSEKESKASLSHIMAQVEEETLMRCINKIHEWSGGIIVATQIKTMPRKYANQPEAAAKDGE